MAFLLGRKIGMTRIFREDGTVVPVTVLAAGPVTVSQLRTLEKDGYNATQVSYATGKKNQRKEFRPAATLAVGDQLDVSVFQPGDRVKVSGLAKGRGFQGAVKRHGFRGMPASHGHHHVLRHVGSIGQRFPQHTLRGMRMAGRMGGKRVTTRGLTVVSVDKEHNWLAVKGAVPGRKGTLLEIVTL